MSQEEGKPTVDATPFEDTRNELPAPERPTFVGRIRHHASLLCRKEGWLGDTSFAELFMPRLDPYGWTQRWRSNTSLTHSKVPFYPVDGDLPVVIGAISGLQHCLAMLAGLITPPIILSQALNLTDEVASYLVSASLIASGLLSLIQITCIPLFRGYQLGTGILSVVGTSFATLSCANAVIANMYRDGTCPVDPQGKQLPCPDGYGYLLGTAALCSLLELLMSLVPVRILQRILPRTVTGIVILLIGSSLIGESGVLNWAGGAGDCASHATGGAATPCMDPRGLPWGSPEYIGLGFLSFVTIVAVEIFGSPAMRSASIVIGLLFPLVVAGPLGYISRENIDAAKPITFLWTHTFKLKIYPQAILPFLAVYVSLAMEAIGDITASSEASRLSTSGERFERRIQGGIMADGLNGCLAALCTITPMSIFAQNNAIISLTQIASRQSGYWCCFWLILFGIVGKIAGCIRAIPSSIIGGVTSFLYMSVAVSGLAVLSKVPINRRNRFVITSGLMFGFGTMLVPNWFAYLFSYHGPNTALQGFLQSITIVLGTPFLIAGLVAAIMNLILPYEASELEEEQRQNANDPELQNGPNTYTTGCDPLMNDARPREQPLAWPAKSFVNEASSHTATPSLAD